MTARRIMARNGWKRNWDVYWVGNNIFYFIFLAIKCVCSYNIVVLDKIEVDE